MIQNRLPHIARLVSRSVDVLSDNSGGQKLELLYERIQEVIEVFHDISTKAESSWIAGWVATPGEIANGEYCNSRAGVTKLT